MRCCVAHTPLLVLTLCRAQASSAGADAKKRQERKPVLNYQKPDFVMQPTAAAVIALVYSPCYSCVSARAQCMPGITSAHRNEVVAKSTVRHRPSALTLLHAATDTNQCHAGACCCSCLAALSVLTHTLRSHTCSRDMSQANNGCTLSSAPQSEEQYSR
jgi:hypothetical protein